MIIRFSGDDENLSTNHGEVMSSEAELELYFSKRYGKARI